MVTVGVDLPAANVDSYRRVLRCPIGFCACRELNGAATGTDESSAVSAGARFGKVDAPAGDVDGAPGAPRGFVIVVEPAGISSRVDLVKSPARANQGGTFGRSLEV